MKHLRRLVAVLMLLTLVCTSGIDTLAATKSSGKTTSANTAEYVEYTVQKGDTLSKIAKKQLGSSKYVDAILELNKDTIKDASKIKVGMTIKLPLVGTLADAKPADTKQEQTEIVPVTGGAVQGTSAKKVGNKINGFKVTAITRFDLINADVVVYEHEKTGAQVMYFANDDTNRLFDITFRTPAVNDTGIPHVFEHSTLDGSAKYPSKSLFFNLSYQTYNTYMNAGTYNFMTSYPVASLSEAQLLKYADYYTDSCFNPIVCTDQSIFTEEAWRYVLNTPEDELTLAGTVYSEMKGSYTLSSAARSNFLKDLFPGSTCGNVSGGIPAHIPEMSWKDLQDYHAKYYHPSNSLTCIYGKFDNFDAFLALLDSYFSVYKKEDIQIADSAYKALTKDVVTVEDYGLAKGADTNKGAYIYYGFAVDADDLDTINKLDFLTTLLGDDSSLLAQNLKKALPSAGTGCYIDFSTPGTAVVFYASGVDESDADLFKKTVDDSLAEIAKQGFDPESVDAIVASYKMDLLMTPESSTIGVDLMPNIAYYWAGMGDMFGFIKYIDAIDDFSSLALDGTLADAITSLVLSPKTHRALVTTRPVAGLKDKTEAELAATLAATKAGMSSKEINAIVEQTRSFSEEDTTDNTEYLRQLTAVTVESLPEEARIYDYDDVTDKSGVRHIDVKANVDEVGQATILFDAAGLTQDQICYFKLYVDLLTKLDTKNYSVAQLSSKITRYLYSPAFKVSLMDVNTPEQFHPYLRSSFITLDEDMSNAYDLIYEILYNTDFTNVDKLKGEISSLRTSTKNSINSSSYAAQIYRAAGATNALYSYYSMINYFGYYDFLTEIEALLESDPTTVVNALKAVASYFKNSTNAISGYVGSEKGSTGHRKVADKFFKKLGSKKIKPQGYRFENIADSEAFITDAAVQYNMIYADNKFLGISEYTADMDVIAAYVSDAYLYPMIRDQYGAYSIMHGHFDCGMYIVSYRDPNIVETFVVYNDLKKFIRQLSDVSQETLDGYILSTYSSYAQSAGELTGGYNALITVISGHDQAEVLDNLKALKSVTPADAERYIDMYTSFIDAAVISTSGSASAINKNEYLFEKIYNLFGSVDPSTVVFKDVPETADFYHPVRFVFENGYVEPDSDDVFGVDSPATLGDYCVTVYMMLGGPKDPQGAVNYLASFGLVPAGNADDTMTRAELTQYTAYLCMALGAEYPKVLLENYPPEGISDGDKLANKVDLAYILTAIVE